MLFRSQIRRQGGGAGVGVTHQGEVGPLLRVRRGEGGGEVLVLCGLHHLRQLTQDFLFGEVDVLEGVVKQVVQRLLFAQSQWLATKGSRASPEFGRAVLRVKNAENSVMATTRYLFRKVLK